MRSTRAKANTQSMQVDNVGNSWIFIKAFFSKLKNADGKVIRVMVETSNSSKSFISSTICVGVLSFWIFLLTYKRIRLINHLKKITNNDKSCKQVKTVQRLAGFSLGISPCLRSGYFWVSYLKQFLGHCPFLLCYIKTFLL